MYRTDKQFMTDPTTSSCRVYIGALPKTVIAQDLEEKFQKYGTILGMMLHSGFAFIQYENERNAQLAIQNEHQSVLNGRKIIVKQAIGGKKAMQYQGAQQKFFNNSMPNPQQHQQQQQKQQQQQQQHQLQKLPQPTLSYMTEHGSLLGLGSQYNISLMEQYSSNNAILGTYSGNNTIGGQPMPAPSSSGIQFNRTPLVGGSKFQNSPNQKTQNDIDNKLSQNQSGTGLHDNSIVPKNDNGSAEKRCRKRRRIDHFQNDTYRDDFYGRDDGYTLAQGVVPYNATLPVDQTPVPDRNDCEIIVVSKSLTKYAEYIEQRLKTIGLIVDLLFPNDDVPIGRVLANISSRGCLYAILVMPQNEEHGSLTLNILHSVPQEHRNMPLEDAIVLITRNFDAYMRGDKISIDNRGTEQMTISDRHPVSMQLLLNMLAENRQITSAQYEKLIKYLQDRRELQIQYEAVEGVNQNSQESNSKQTELQNRIMNILNKSTEVQVNPTDSEQSNVADVETTPPTLLKDPSVQKALDSLIGGDVFKNITTTP